MEFKKGNNCIFVGESEDAYDAYIHYTDASDGTAVIDRTIVDSKLGGKGVGGKLVSAVVERAREENFKLNATCSFAKKKLEETPEYSDVYDK